MLMASQIMKTTRVRHENTSQAFPRLMYAIDTLLVAKYKGMIVTAHSETCPWRHHGCPPTIHRLPLTNAHASLSALKARYTALLSPSIELPPASAIRLTTTPSPSTEALTKTISSTRTDFDLFPPHEATPPTNDSSSSSATDPQPLWPSSSLPTHHATLTLATLGWEVPSSSSSSDSSTVSILHCTSCFRRLGLWLYTSGTLSHLDAIDEHLEYCPWRSPTAQAFESKSDSEMAGWQILARTMEREIMRKRRGKPTRSLGSRKAETGGPNGTNKNTTREDVTTAEVEASREDQEEESVEEREKKMKALMRKIRELKKPFDVKGLLKKKG